MALSYADSKEGQDLSKKVFVTREIPERGLLLLREHFTVKVWPEELPPPRDVLLREAGDADGLVTLLTDRVDAELLDHAPRLRIVSNYAVGYDNFDLRAATARDVMMTNTPGVLTETTADLAFALLMAVARRIVESVDFVKRGQWKTWGPQLLLGQDIHGATLGLVGLGRIGLSMARRAKGFDMQVLYSDVARNEAAERELGLTFVDLETLLRQSDFVSLHVPLTPATRHMLNRESLKLMKPTAVLINTARGAVVDEEALYHALKSHHLAGAGLDVTDPEPMELSNKLLSLENVVVVPHIASASVKTRTRMAVMAAENMVAGLSGRRPPNILNPKAIPFP